MRRQKFFVAVCAIVVALFISEFIVRMLPKDITKIDYGLIDEERIFVASRNMRFRPNLTRVWTGLGRPTIWHFNDLGYRERGIQLDKPDNIYRIVFLGDSVVMGFGVEEYESLPRRLENELRPMELVSSMTHFEVLNLGIQGFSSPQYLAVLKEDVLKMNADLMIVGFYSNDVLEGVSFEENKKYLFLKSLPDILPYKVSRFLKRNSELYLMLLTRYYTVVEKSSVKIEVNETTTNRGWEIAKRDLVEINRLANEKGIKFVLLGIPNSSKVMTGEVSKRRVDELKEISDDNGIIYYELFDDIEAYEGDLSELYLEDFNDHFSPKGNDYLAELVARFLRDNLVIPEK